MAEVIKVDIRNSGKKEWKKAKKWVNDEDINIIVVYPEGFHPSMRFWAEFFSRLEKSYTKSEIKEMFQSEDETFERYLRLP